jgi:muconolactone delta-isomerase
MKFLAVCRPRTDAPMDRFAALVPDEAEDLRRLKAQGILLEAWSPGGPGAVLIIEAPSASEAEGILDGLPLGVAGLIDVELTPLHELGI